MAHKQNYVDKMELTKQQRIAAGLVSERFPEVSDMVINMTYYQKGVNPVMMIRIVNFLPSRYAYFNMDCMVKGCADGGFDLTSVITKMIKNHKKTGKGKLVCNGKSEGLASDHASIDYEVMIKYNKR
ncbi:MAG: hypothetical protein WA126_11160 [Thermodesulfovibrionales bacterium]